jgi:TQO small subunit DoxD
MAGALTRAAALVSMGFSVLLMAMFGWQGATCIDEWTMAACNLAMGATLLLGGSGAYAIDNVLIRRNPALAEKAWFRWMAGSLPLPLKDIAFRNAALAVLGFVEIGPKKSPPGEPAGSLNKINGPFLYELKGTPAEYKAGLDRAIAADAILHAM